MDMGRKLCWQFAAATGMLETPQLKKRDDAHLIYSLKVLFLIKCPLGMFWLQTLG
jgi:hypothetical protein